MVFGGEAAVLHVGGFGGLGPLIGVEIGGVEDGWGIGGVAPFAVLECGEVEMDEHAKAEVEEFLLELLEGFILVVGGRHGLGSNGDWDIGDES